MKLFSRIIRINILLITSYLFYLILSKDYPISFLILIAGLIIHGAFYYRIIQQRHKYNYTELIKDIEAITEIAQRTEYTRNSISTLLNRVCGRIMRIIDDI